MPAKTPKGASEPGKSCCDALVDSPAEERALLISMFTGVFPSLPVITTEQSPNSEREIGEIEEVSRGTARDLLPATPEAVFRNGLPQLLRAGILQRLSRGPSVHCADGGRNQRRHHTEPEEAAQVRDLAAYDEIFDVDLSQQPNLVLKVVS